MGNLLELEDLQFAGFELGELPPSLAHLTQLSRLHLGMCGLRAVPEEIWRLPRLRYLFLSRNALTTTCNAPDLPQLEVLDLHHNQLTELPDELLAQPALRQLDLRDNPWRTLPGRCNDLDVRLSITDKRRLLDYEYKDADGQRAGPWNDDVFYAQSHAPLQPDLDRLFESPILTPHRAMLQPTIKHALLLQHDGEDEMLSTGGHRFGGMPDLPPSIPYPRYGSRDAEEIGDGPNDYAYEFIAQLNLAALAPLQDYLPREGMLYFFLTTMHDLYGGASQRPAKVVHFDGDLTTLRSGRSIQLEAHHYFEMMDNAYPCFRARAQAALSAPSLYAVRQNPHVLRGGTLPGDFAEDDVSDALDQARRSIPHDHAVNAHGFTQNEDPENQAALAHRGAPDEWTTLLEVSSTGGFQWGDAGNLFFVIHKSDLARRDFRNVFCTMESS